MRKHFFAIAPATVLAASLMLFTDASQAADDGGLATLRGAPVSAQEKSPTGDGLKKAIETAPIDRNFLDQPPLVSHAVDEYPVTRDINKCLDCHSVENYKKEKATRVSKTHFEGADGKTLSSISSRRHFCLQCHVPQIDAKPLVTNTFQRAK
ncbi:MAG: nitrate reductase cytochrome c-type subunit [Betaproteobacteria bacterium]|nr:nitrate reductase cytochrome c-type subunit [Betaproteobacteria bacterium]